MLKYLERESIEIDLEGITAEDIMSTPAITINQETRLSEIMTLLSANRINRVPVIDTDNKLIGIVSRAILSMPLFLEESALMIHKILKKCREQPKVLQE